MPVRSKDLIDRGCHVVDAAAVDSVLLSHPAIQDAASFPIGQAKSEPELACAIVLRPGFQLHRASLRVFASRSLSASDVPPSIFFLSKIPRSPTGRPQRVLLARQIAELQAAGWEGAHPVSSEANLDAVEADLLQRWRTTLKSPTYHPDQDFFSAGGDAAAAEAMLQEVKTACKLRYRLLSDSFAYEPTIFHLAEMIRYGQEMRAPQPLTHRIRIVPVRERSTYLHEADSSNGQRPLLYLLPPDGDEGTCFRMLSDALGPEWPVSVVRPAGLLHKPGPYQIEEAARECAALILADSGERPFAVGGFCYGGILAAEIARLLEGSGCSALVLFDTPLPGHPHYFSRLRFASDNLRWLRTLYAARHEPGAARKYGKTLLKRVTWHAIRASRTVVKPVWQTRPFQAIARRASAADMPFFFKLKPLRLPVLHLLSAGHKDLLWREAVLDWHQVAPGKVTIARLTGAHLRLFFGANLLQMVSVLESWFEVTPASNSQEAAPHLTPLGEISSLEQEASSLG